MNRTVDVDMETRAAKFETALRRFLKKYPELEYWAETFQYMAENEIDFFSDTTLANGEKNKDWAYALHLDANPDPFEEGRNYYYIAVIERA